MRCASDVRNRGKACYFACPKLFYDAVSKKFGTAVILYTVLF